MLTTREFRTKFDAQEITNLAVQERLQRDPDLEGLLSAQLRLAAPLSRIAACCGEDGDLPRSPSREAWPPQSRPVDGSPAAECSARQSWALPIRLQAPRLRLGDP